MNMETEVIMSSPKKTKKPNHDLIIEESDFENKLLLNINIMDIIDLDDRNLLENSRIINMSRIDWGKRLQFLISIYKEIF